jgi:hypothetical protein
MNRHFLNRAITLMAVLGLAGMGLLLPFLLLGQNTVSATSERASPVPNIRAQGASFTVSGTVTCEVTGLISDVEVFVWNRNKGTGVLSDTTDISGTYSVTMTEGSYDLTFNPLCGSECASKAHKGITGPDELTLNVVLPPGYTVSGTVYATGTLQTISNTALYFFNHETADGFGLPPTDKNGHYCVNLAEGYDDLSFTPPACLGLGPKAGIIVTQTMTRNVTLPPGFTVSGCITDGPASPVPGVQIYAYSTGIGGFGFAPTNETGCYTGSLPYAGIPPTGTYDIQFIPPPGLGLGSVTEINVVSKTVGCPNTSLPITLPVGFTISSTVTCQGQPVKNVYVYADPVGEPAPGDELVGWGLYTVDDGSCGLPVVPDTYDIKFIPPPATGFDTVVITDVQVITDTVLEVNLCPLYLPIILKNHP